MWRLFLVLIYEFTIGSSDTVVGCMIRGVVIVGGCSSYVFGFVAARARHSIISYSNGLLTITFE